MRFLCFRFAVVAATLAYLLAGALGALHHHEHGLSHPPQVACEQHAAGEDHAPAHSPGPLSDDDCLACRLAAQSAVVCVPVADAGRCPLVVEVRSTAPTFFLEPVRSCGLARAPPTA